MKCTDCHQSLRPVVALDVDGSLAQYHKHFLDFLCVYYDTVRMPDRAVNYDGTGEFSDAIGMDKRAYQDAKLAFRSGGFKRWMPAYPFASGLSRRMKAMDVEVWITTTRPWMRLDNMDPDTREWLRRNQIKFDHILYDEDKYGVLVERVGVERIVAVLEDQQDQIDRCVDIGLPVLTHMTSFNRAIHPPYPCSNLGIVAEVMAQMVSHWREQHG